MTQATATGLDLHNLSVNWKRLQEKLKAENSKSPPKREAAEPQPQYKNKRQKLGQSLPCSNGDAKTRVNWSKPEESAALSATLALWAEDNDISPKDLHAAYGTSLKSTSLPDLHALDEIVNQGLSPIVSSSLSSVGKYIAIDCEMVGVGPKPDAESALARVSIVDYHGRQLYDSYVKPKEAITDYRTAVSGITSAHLLQARTLETVQNDVGRLLDGKILVGHSIRHDLDAMLLPHPRRDIRDTSRHPAFRSLAGGRTPALKKLAKAVLGVEIQGGEHSSVEDARATMLLFRREKEEFEREHRAKWGLDRRTTEHAEIKKGHQKRSKKKKKARR